MPKTLLKRCCKCDQPVVRIDKEEWRWAKRTIFPSETDPDFGKPICKDCRTPIQATVLYPYAVWEVTKKGFQRTLIDSPEEPSPSPTK
jgi:hypothetical protein